MSFDDWYEQHKPQIEPTAKEQYWDAYQTGYRQCLGVLRVILDDALHTLDALSRPASEDPPAG